MRKTLNIYENKDIKNLTALKIGGTVKKFYTPKNLEELQNFFKGLISDDKDKIKILGSGTNILVQDEEILDFNVIKLEGEFAQISISKTELKAGAGAFLPNFIKKFIASGVGGLEILAGIPGTIGGAISGNAGSKYGNILDFVEQIKTMDYDGNIEILRKKNLVFGYRKLVFPKPCIICEVIFDTAKFKAENPNDIKKNYDKILKEKIASQPYNCRTIGCIFKNPENTFSGKLIDDANLKNTKVGNIRISEKHANFFIAENDAKFKDFMDLIYRVKNKIKDLNDIELELEIKIWQNVSQETNFNQTREGK